MYKLNVKTLGIAIVLMGISIGCDNRPAGSDSDNRPFIDNISPKKGTIGTQVTINGKNFSAETNENTVRFDDVAAPINSASETNLVIKVPDGLTIDKVAPNKGIIEVKVSANGKEAKSPANFKVTQDFDSPPFGGTIFEDPDIITSSDPTTFRNVSYEGRERRQIFDRRSGFITVDVYLIKANFTDGQTVDIKVNPEFANSDSALAVAKKYASEFGKIPRALRNATPAIAINKGTYGFGGGSDGLTIHTGQGDEYIDQGILPETIVHECTHVLDYQEEYSSSSGWQGAVNADSIAISPYARDNPDREDIAESFLPYLAIRYRPDRVPNSYTYKVKQAIPNRIAYFDSLSANLDLSPFEKGAED